MFERLRSIKPMHLVLVFCAAILATAGTATAAKLITSKDIKNRSIQNIDIKKNNLTGQVIKNNSITAQDVRNNSLTGQQIKDGSIQVKDLAPNARPKPVERGLENPHWGVIARNTIGSPIAELRGGPFVTTPSGDVVAPPYGEGSLGLAVAAHDKSNLATKEKASYGNEVDFAGDNFLAINELGFHVFTTGENFAAGEPMPVLNIEIDPNLDGIGDDYTTAVWVPDNVASQYVNTWSPYIDATSSGKWYLTGNEEAVCKACSFSELMAALDDGGEPPVVLTVAVSKGRDTAFVGAVDGLRVNDTIYDFEPYGVVERKLN